MANGFVNQFTTGRPYVNPTVAIDKPQVSISIPRLPDGEDEPTNDPEKNPNNNQTKQSNPATKPVQQPKTTGNHSSFWGNIGRDLGIGAGVVGTAGALGKGAYDLLKTGAGDIGVNLPSSSTAAEDVIDAGKGIFTRAASTVPEEISMGSKLINGADYNVLQPAEKTVQGLAENAPKAINSWQKNLSSQFDDIMKSNAMEDIGGGLEAAGAGAGEGLATEAPLAAGTIAVGGGPEDPFADAAAGIEEGTGALIGAGMGLASRFF